MSIFLTIFAGVVTYVLGQLVMKLIIEPVHEFKRVIANISHSLIEYANVYSNPGITGNDNEKNVSTVTRKLSSQLNAQIYLIPHYELTSKIFGLPPRKIVAQAALYLIGLSNSVGKSAANIDLASNNAEKVGKIRVLLDIYVPKEDR